MTQEEYNQNRFKYLNDYDDEKIMSELEETKAEKARCEDAINNGEVKGEALTETENDLKYANDLEAALTEQASKRGLLKQL